MFVCITRSALWAQLPAVDSFVLSVLWWNKKHSLTELCVYFGIKGFAWLQRSGQLVVRILALKVNLRRQDTGNKLTSYTTEHSNTVVSYVIFFSISLSAVACYTFFFKEMIVIKILIFNINAGLWLSSTTWGKWPLIHRKDGIFFLVNFATCLLISPDLLYIKTALK